jgi:hypothetical protein
VKEEEEDDDDEKRSSCIKFNLLEVHTDRISPLGGSKASWIPTMWVRYKGILIG